MKKLSSVFVMVIALLAITGPAAWAGAANMSVDPGRVQWDVEGDYERAVLSVSMPDGEVVRQEFDGKATPVFELASGAKDGAYTFELRLVPRINASLRRALAEARKSGDEAAIAQLRAELPEAPVVSGGFMVQAGSIVTPEGKEPQSPQGRKVTTSAGSVGVVTAADQVIPDDLIVQGSICAGFDCVNNENFGFDTIRLKENNLRIKFEDTSTGTFPSNDWQLTANDSASGGQNKFSIEDITGAKVPFTIEAGATTNSVYLDSTGRVGFRTSTPVLDIHISTTNTPGIRLEQTNAGGFTAQTWDVAGNEANFFVRDVTSGSRLPFRIRPGAPTSSIDISADGDVGVGTGSPDASLHVARSDGTAKLRVEETNGTATLRNLMTLTNNGGIQFLLDRTDAGQNDWQVSNFGASFAVSVPGAATNQMTLTAAGNMTISGTTYAVGSSRSLKENFTPIDNLSILQRVVDMPLTQWNAKADPGQKHIGPVAEEWWATFGLGSDDKHVSLTDVGGVALAAIKGLNQVVTEKDKEIAELKGRLEMLEKMVQDLALQK